MTDYKDELDSFIAAWPDSEGKCREVFADLREMLQGLDGVTLEFISRPGVTYSLRASHQNQKETPLFVMADVIEDDPRWLSVCFYGKMVSDPGEMGDYVPGGLLGEDGICFDMERREEERLTYIKQRIAEAYEVASR